MKKNYIAPAIEVIDAEVENSLLAMSTELDPNTEATTVGTPEMFVLE